MFESIVQTTETSITALPAILLIVEAFAMGVIIGLCYMFTQKKYDYSKEYIVAIAILPAIVALVIMLVGSSVARALSLAGAFALVRFRSAQGTAKEIAFVFFAMSIGLATGLGFVYLAPVATAVICACIIAICKSRIGEKKHERKILKITIPEDLNYDGIFDDLLKEYTCYNALARVRTTNMGSLYEITFYVVLKNNVPEKEFIDALRCRNGNLNISLGLIPDKTEATL